MAVYLYKPPTWRNVFVFERGHALRAGITTSTCVYRIDGVWYNVQSPGMDDPVVADVDVWVDPSNAANQLRLFFVRPMVVPGALYDELAAITPADPSWTPGSLTLL